MAHPTDDELEALAQRLELVGPTDIEVVDMLRACKGRLKRLPRGDGAGGWTLPVELLAEIRDEVYASEWDAPCAEIIEIIALSAEARILSALEPAPDHADWNAAIEAVIVNLKTYAPHQDDTGPEHDIGYAAGYHTALNRLSALKKGPSHD